MRNVEFGAVGTAGQLLDGAAIEIARPKIHAWKSVAGCKYPVDEADAFEQLRPVDVGDQAEARDDISHGDARGPVPLMLRVRRDTMSRYFLSGSVIECNREEADAPPDLSGHETPSTGT